MTGTGQNRTPLRCLKITPSFTLERQRKHEESKYVDLSSAVLNLVLVLYLAGLVLIQYLNPHLILTPTPTPISINYCFQIHIKIIAKPVYHSR